MQFKTGSGKTIHEEKEIGGGNEGTAFTIRGEPSLAGKRYNHRADDDKIKEAADLKARRAKIESMISCGLASRYPLVAFPLDTLFHMSGDFAGFNMRLISNSHEIHKLYDSRDRKDCFPQATIADIVQVGVNLALAVDELHRGNCVIGDINEGGILVRDDGMVVLIDCDSFQFEHAGRVHPCVVGTPIYQPPENQGISARDIKQRTDNQDNYGLAFMIFRLLMNAFQPFTGRYLGRGEQPRASEWIKQHLYVYGKDASRRQITPPRDAPSIEWLCPEIREAFERAFSVQGRTQRPTAREWAGLLDRFQASLQTCNRNQFHHHQPQEPCPWCIYEARLGGPVIGPRVLGRDEELRGRQAKSAPTPSPSATSSTTPPPTSPRPQPVDPQLPWRGIMLAIGGLALVAGLYSLGQPTGRSQRQTAPLAIAAPVTMPSEAPDTAPPIYETSFDCSGASDWVEKMTCASAELAEKDRTMAALYRPLLENSSKSAREQLRGSQVDWLRERNNCTDVACIDQVYNSRISVLRDWTAQGLPWSKAVPFVTPQRYGEGATQSVNTPAPSSGRSRQRASAENPKLIMCTIPSRYDGTPRQERLTPEECDRNNGIPN